MDVDLGLKHMHIYKIDKHACGNLNVQLWGSFAPSRAFKGWSKFIDRMMHVNNIGLECHI